MPVKKSADQCHTCHMTEPISLAELIRTHPLRAVDVRRNKDGASDTEPLSSSSARPPGKKSNGVTLQLSPTPPPPPPPPQPLPPRNSILNGGSKSNSNGDNYARPLKKTQSKTHAAGALSSTGGGHGASRSDRKLSISELQPIESFLHSPWVQRVFGDHSTTTAEPEYAELKRSKRLEAFVGKNDKGSHRSKSGNRSSSKRNEFRKSSSSEDYSVHYNQKQSASIRKISDKVTTPGYDLVGAGVAGRAAASSGPSNTSSLRPKGDISANRTVTSVGQVSALKRSSDAQVQTYDVAPTAALQQSSVKKATGFAVVTAFLSKRRQGGCGWCPRLPLGFLIAGYALLILLAIVIGVAVAHLPGLHAAQKARTTEVPGSAVAESARNMRERLQLLGRSPTLVTSSATPNSAPDYFFVDGLRSQDSDFVLPPDSHNEVRTAGFPFGGRQDLEGQPSNRGGLPDGQFISERPTTQDGRRLGHVTPNSNDNRNLNPNFHPRDRSQLGRDKSVHGLEGEGQNSIQNVDLSGAQVIPNTQILDFTTPNLVSPPPRFDQRPTLHVETDPNGSKTITPRLNLNQEPDLPRVAKIVRSWSNSNPDGTFSYGYLNSDGSYKNETRGVDCVVRGVYGYVDEETGATLSFPYMSGNPCQPGTVTSNTRGTITPGPPQGFIRQGHLHPLTTAQQQQHALQQQQHTLQQQHTQQQQQHNVLQKPVHRPVPIQHQQQVVQQQPVPHPAIRQQQQHPTIIQQQQHPAIVQQQQQQQHPAIVQQQQQQHRQQLQQPTIIQQQRPVHRQQFHQPTPLGPQQPTTHRQQVQQPTTTQQQHRVIQPLQRPIVLNQQQPVHQQQKEQQQQRQQQQLSRQRPTLRTPQPTPPAPKNSHQTHQQAVQKQLLQSQKQHAQQLKTHQEQLKRQQQIQEQAQQPQNTVVPQHFQTPLHGKQQKSMQQPGMTAIEQLHRVLQQQQRQQQQEQRQKEIRKQQQRRKQQQQQKQQQVLADASKLQIQQQQLQQRQERLRQQQQQIRQQQQQKTDQERRLHQLQLEKARVLQKQQQQQKQLQQKQASEQAPAKQQPQPSKQPPRDKEDPNILHQRLQLQKQQALLLQQQAQQRQQRLNQIEQQKQLVLQLQQQHQQLAQQHKNLQQNAKSTG